jgi:hypothetical protein
MTHRRHAQEGDVCALCERTVALTFHHLIPLSLHRKRRYQDRFDQDTLRKGILVCRACHDAIHRFIPHRDLAEHYHTLERLREHQELERFLRWVRRQRRRVKVRKPRR